METLPSTQVLGALAPAAGLEVDVEIRVGNFFWIETCIGMAENATHRHGVHNKPNPGSADEQCWIRILSTESNYATVVLLRPKLPSGAQAPHGTIFLLPLDVLERWPKMSGERSRQEELRARMRKDLGIVRV